MQLIIDIKNESMADKIKTILSAFKNDGVEIKETVSTEPETNLSDEYIEKHWREILMGIKSDPNYYKSEQYKLDRGEYLMEKYQ
jgi:hypothetical protein